MTSEMRVIYAAAGLLAPANRLLGERPQLPSVRTVEIEGKMQ